MNPGAVPDQGNARFNRGAMEEQPRFIPLSGGDYFVLRDFVDMVRYDREPWIDVYDAATWSVIYHCSRLSIDRKGAAVEMPDFTGGRWKDANWRKDSSKPV